MGTSWSLGIRLPSESNGAKLQYHVGGVSEFSDVVFQPKVRRSAYRTKDTRQSVKIVVNIGVACDVESSPFQDQVTFVHKSELGIVGIDIPFVAKTQYGLPTGTPCDKSIIGNDLAVRDAKFAAVYLEKVVTRSHKSNVEAAQVVRHVDRTYSAA
jgi:hypothetical protein